MSDKFHSLTVVLRRNLPSEEAELLMNSIRQFREVADVTRAVADAGAYVSDVRARQHYADKLWEVLYPKNGK